MKELIGIVKIKKRNNKAVRYIINAKEGESIYFELDEYYPQTNRWFSMKESKPCKKLSA